MFKNIFDIIHKKDRSTLNIIILLNILIFIFEFISLASVPIFVSISINSEFFIQKVNSFTNSEIFSQFSQKDLILFSGSFVIGAFLIKNVFLMYHTFLQGKFFKKIKVGIANSLFNFYINSPYLYHLSNNPSSLSRNISSEIQNSSGYIFHVLALLKESLTILVIITLLVFVNPIITLIVSSFLSILIIIYINKVKPLLKKRALQNQEILERVTQTVFETFGAIKDLKILNKEKEIQKYFDSKIKILEQNTYFFSFYERFPRVILELISIVTITLVSLIYLNFNPNLISLIPTLTLLVVSLVRFIPAFSAITTSITYIKHFEPSIKLIGKEIRKINANQNDIKFKYNNLISGSNSNNSRSFFSLENVSFSYPGSKIFPIRNINLNIEKASKIGITGKTGAGKSTLFHLMLGLLTPQKGNIFYKGSNIFSDLNNWRNKIGYISQNIYLLDASIKKNIAFNFLDEPIDEQKLNNAINIANLEQKIANLPNGVNTVVGNDGVKLSGGERQRIALARAIYREPSIFFMDESTSALDTKTEEIVMNNIKNKFKDKTMIIIAHRKSTIEMCDKVLNLKDGSLI